MQAQAYPPVESRYACYPHSAPLNTVIGLVLTMTLALLTTITLLRERKRAGLSPSHIRRRLSSIKGRGIMLVPSQNSAGRP